MIVVSVVANGVENKSGAGVNVGVEGICNDAKPASCARPVMISHGYRHLVSCECIIAMLYRAIMRATPTMRMAASTKYVFVIIWQIPSRKKTLRMSKPLAAAASQDAFRPLVFGIILLKPIAYA
eukprot:scaffold14176_cov50-Prasinocladus_malaysianus.AAC.2